MELAKAGAFVLIALELEVMGAPRGTPCPLLMAVATADCPGDPTAVAVRVPVATAAAESQNTWWISSILTIAIIMLSLCLLLQRPKASYG